MRTDRTYSIPEDIDRDLHQLIGRRNISHFVAESVRKNLKSIRKDLAKEYAAANKDRGQKEALKDWESTICEGLEIDRDQY